jgi:hypothetical protein
MVPPSQYYLSYLVLFTLPFTHSSTPSLLNLTAITARHNASTLECWQLLNPPSTFAGAINYPLAASTGGYVGVIAPQTYIGQAWAPHPQISLFLSGLGHITMPESSLEVWVQGGKYGIILAMDTREISARGHITDFPGGDTTVIAQFPCVALEHVVLHGGPCGMEEMLGM